MTDRFEWFDVSPKRAVLYQINKDNPFNKKIAEVFYNELDKDGFVVRLHDKDNPLIREWVAQSVKTKQEAMELALAELVARRIDKANNT